MTIFGKTEFHYGLFVTRHDQFNIAFFSQRLLITRNLFVPTGLRHLCRQRLWLSNVSHNLTTIKYIFTLAKMFSDSSACNELQESSRAAMMPPRRWKMRRHDKNNKIINRQWIILCSAASSRNGCKETKLLCQGLFDVITYLAFNELTINLVIDVIHTFPWNTFSGVFLLRKSTLVIKLQLCPTTVLMLV